MSLTLIIILNVALDVTLLGGLAWLLSRPSRLTPHEPAIRPLPARRESRRSRAQSAPDWSAQTSRQAA